MNLRIRRRRFGQLAIASATATAIANFTGKAVAQNSNSTIYGISLSKSKLASVTKVTDLINITPAMSLVSSDLATGRQLLSTEIASTTVQNLNTVTETAGKAVYTETSERITGFTALSNGRFVVSTVVATQKGNYNRFVTIDNRLLKVTQALKASKLAVKNSTLENLVATKDNRLIGIFSSNGGTSFFNLVVIDINTGVVSSKNELALPDLIQTQRYSNLALSPNGKIYATNLGSQGSTILVQLDLDNKAVVSGKGKIVSVSTLTLDKQPLENDLSSLAFSPLGELYALADPKNEGTNSLFTVNLKTGEMKLLRKFPVDKIAFGRL